MARRKKPDTIDEQIALVENDIEVLKGKLQRKEDELKKLNEQKVAEENQELLKMIIDSGIDKDQVAEAIKSIKK